MDLSSEWSLNVVKMMQTICHFSDIVKHTLDVLLILYSFIHTFIVIYLFTNFIAGKREGCAGPCRRYNILGVWPNVQPEQVRQR